MTSIDAGSTAERELVEAFQAFARVVLTRLREAAVDVVIQTRLRHRVLFEGEDFYDDGEFRPRYWPLVDTIWDAKLWNDATIEASVRTLLEAGVLFPPTVTGNDGQRIADPSFEAMNPELVQGLLPQIVATAEEAKSLEPPDEVLRNAAISFIRSRTEPQPWSFSVPLINLSSEVVPITFGRLTLDPLGDDEKSRLWGPGSIHVEMIRLLDLLRSTLKLSYCGVHEKAMKHGAVSVGPFEAELRSEAGHLVTALRLLKSGQVGAPIYAHLEEEHGMSHMGNQTPYRTDEDLSPDRFELRGCEIAQVQEIFNSLQKANANGTLAALDIALRRFNLSYARSTPDDRVVDFAIAYEASVLHGVKDELRYRLALRTAALLRETYKPDATSTFMKKFYDVRSQVVHEGVPLHVALKKQKVKRYGSTESMPAGEFISHAGELLRACLCVYLRVAASGSSIGTLNEELDAQIISSLQTANPPRN